MKTENRYSHQHVDAATGGISRDGGFTEAVDKALHRRVPEGNDGLLDGGGDTDAENMLEGCLIEMLACRFEFIAFF